MKLTLLDRFIGTCTANSEMMPVYRNMVDAIRETVPVAHLWNTHKLDMLETPLPAQEISWPDAAMCLYTPTGMTPGYHRFCVDVDYTGGDFEPWFELTTWTLEGALIFQPAPDSFDVIPLAVETARGEIVLPEIQLHFELIDGKWTWSKATTGPVNSMFHDYFIDKIEDCDQPDVHEAINDLGNVVNLYLGTYWEHMLKPGIWAIYPSRAPKQKVRNGKVRKTYKPGSAGFKEYQLDMEDK